MKNYRPILAALLVSQSLHVFRELEKFTPAGTVTEKLVNTEEHLATKERDLSLKVW